VVDLEDLAVVVLAAAVRVADGRFQQAMGNRLKIRNRQEAICKSQYANRQRVGIPVSEYHNILRNLFCPHQVI